MSVGRNIDIRGDLPFDEVPMEIVTIMHDFRGGGAEKAAVMLADGFARLGAASEIVCVALEGPMEAELPRTLPIKCIGVQRAYLALPILVRLMRQRPHAFFLSHLTHMNVVVVLASLLSGHRRTFVVEHNDLQSTAADLKNSAIKAAFLVAPLLYSRAAGVFCVSKSVRDSLSTNAGAMARCSIVANPISPRRLDSECAKDVASSFFRSSVPTVVACGRLTKQKNYPMMLKAIQLIAKSKDIRLIVLGDGPDREALHDMTRSLEIADLVLFAGFVPNPHPFFDRARLLLSTSDWEGLPMTLIEALYCGADFVATRSCSGIAELSLSGQFGTCVERQDLEGFVSAVLERLERPVAPLSEKRQHLAAYEVDHVANVYVDFMRSAVHSRYAARQS